MFVVFGLPMIVFVTAYVAASSEDMNAVTVIRGLRALIVGTVLTGFFLLFVLLILTHADAPRLYPLSYLPTFHPWNTVPYKVGPYSAEAHDSRLIMKRRIFLGSSTDTLRSAKTNCTRLLQGTSEGSNCLIQSCSAPTDSAIKTFLSDTEKKQLCGSSPSDRDYLYILGYQEVWPGC